VRAEVWWAPALAGPHRRTLAGRPHSGSPFGEGFRTPAVTNGSTGTGAGVRKPPRTKPREACLVPLAVTAAGAVQYPAAAKTHGAGPQGGTMGILGATDASQALPGPECREATARAARSRQWQLQNFPSPLLHQLTVGKKMSAADDQDGGPKSPAGSLIRVLVILAEHHALEGGQTERLSGRLKCRREPWTRHVVTGPWRVASL
jgi:hypothetical protein